MMVRWFPAILLFTQKIFAFPKPKMKQRSNNLLFYQQFLPVFRKKTTPVQSNKISARLTKYKRKIFSYCAYEMRSDLILIAKSSLELE